MLIFTTKEKNLIRRVRKLLSNPKRWTQGSLAKTKDQYQVFYNSKDAVCWCLSGAFFKLSVCGSFSQELDIVPTIQKIINLNSMKESFPTFNDNHTHEEVLGLLDNTIKEFS